MESRSTLDEELTDVIEEAHKADLDVCGAYDVTTSDGTRYSIEITQLISE